MELGRLTPSKKYKLTLLIFFSLWLAFTLIAPFTVPGNSVNDLSGKASQIDNERTWGKMNPFAASMYFLGDAFCTEITDHSYFLNGNQMPFCARCTGIFIGLVVGMVVAIVLDPKIRLWLLALGLLPILVDGGLQLVTSYQSVNPLRVATGLLAGMVVSLYLSRMANTLLEPRPKGQKEAAH